MRSSEKQLEKWSKTRRMGRGRYVWLVWVLGWGVVNAILWAAICAYLQGWDKLPNLVAFGLIGFPTAGYFVGRLMWRRAEKDYQQSAQSV